MQRVEGERPQFDRPMGRKDRRNEHTRLPTNGWLQRCLDRYQTYDCDYYCCCCDIIYISYQHADVLNADRLWNYGRRLNLFK